MKNFWICAFFIASIGLYATAQAQDDYDDYYSDYNEDEDLKKKVDEDIPINDKTDNENDLNVKKEIQQFRETDEERLDDIDTIRDYQFEDNRDKIKEESNDKEEISSNEDGSFEGDDDEIENPVKESQNNDYNVENRPEPDDKSAAIRNADYALLWGDDSVAPLPVPEPPKDAENKAILEETKNILEEDTDDFEEDIKKRYVGINVDDKHNMEKILNETKKLLAENDDSFSFDKANTLNEEAIENADSETDNEKNYEKVLENNDEASEEDTVSKVLPDLNLDLDKLLETLNSDSDLDKLLESFKPKDDGSDSNGSVEDTDNILEETDKLFEDKANTLNEEAIENADSESDNEKNNKEVLENNDEASEEDTVSKVYADLNSDLDKLLETLNKLKDDGSDGNGSVEDIDNILDETDKLFEDNYDDNIEGSEELVEDNKDSDMDLDFDKILKDILSEDDMKAEEDTAAEDVRLLNDALNEPNPDDSFVKDVESFDEKLKPILYLNDALVNNEPKEVNSVESNATNASVEKESVTPTNKVATVLVNQLTSAELNDVIDQFSILYKEDLDVHSEKFDKNVGPVHLSLKLDEPTVITSPEYPKPYPTNNVVDWIIEGEGMGIELNITELAVNGAFGDYLLIKPGGVDESGHDGLIFTYRLNSERRYRFADVDRLFMRFESKPGPSSYKGFVISAKMIAPTPEDPEPIPEPEAVVPPPHSTTTLTLGVAVPSIRQMKEEFRVLLADMAEEYIRDNEVDPGLNTTSEVTKITSIGLCPITWPNYEGCSAVTFGVSLVQEEPSDPRLNEEDLQEMWRTYSRRDPFALRLSRMGITEFSPPDSAVMTAWLVIAGGVAISMMMLALVLWRYSCFEDYTRMKSFSDTDSLQNEKRNLDLYPTPHQTLPPLYAESEYKWNDQDTRVDIGGFANQSYARENMYDFESDEDVIAQRDRNGALSARSISDV